MLTITSPANLSPFDRPAIFKIASDTPAADAGRYIEALLEDSDSGTILAARRIRLSSTATAQFDAAPILRRSVTFRPAGGATGLIAADECRFRVRLAVRWLSSEGGAPTAAAQSAAVTLISTAPKSNLLTLITSMPAQRTICYGESDTLTLYAPAGFTATIEALSPSSGSRRFDYKWSGSAGLVTLRLRTTDFDPAVERIMVLLNGGTVVEYTVEPACSEGMRIAWRTTAGTLEHYTFPVVARRTLAAGSRTIRLADGTCTVAGRSHTEAVVRSSYESRAVVGALAEIAESPQVWTVDGETGEYIETDVLTSEIVTHLFGEPSNVELTVRPSQNGVRI